MVTFIPSISIYPSHVSIYTSTMDPSWDMDPWFVAIKQPFKNSPSKRQDPWISWIPSTKKGEKNRGHSQIQFPTKTRFSMLASSLLYIYILHNIIYYHHFLLFPSLLYILHIIISVATDTETTTEFATIVRLLRLFITSPDVGFAHRMVEHGWTNLKRKAIDVPCPINKKRGYGDGFPEDFPCFFNRQSMEAVADPIVSPSAAKGRIPVTPPAVVKVRIIGTALGEWNHE